MYIFFQLRDSHVMICNLACYPLVITSTKTYCNFVHDSINTIPHARCYKLKTNYINHRDHSHVHEMIIKLLVAWAYLANWSIVKGVLLNNIVCLLHEA